MIQRDIRLVNRKRLAALLEFALNDDDDDDDQKPKKKAMKDKDGGGARDAHCPVSEMEGSDFTDQEPC